MIFLTGDTHGKFKHRFSHENFPQKALTTKKDIVIILGDFGGVFSGGALEQSSLDWLNSQPFTTAFIDGNHEAFPLLEKFPTRHWCGGEVGEVRNSVFHLKRGQVYTIQGNTFFAMGGAPSIDRNSRIEGVSWWKEEIPSHVEYGKAIDKLHEWHWTVDYILTHTAPDRLVEKFLPLLPVYDQSLNKFLDTVLNAATYHKHFFGHFHQDLEVGDKHQLLYEKIIQIK